MACLDELLSNISIHAPPRGATKITAIDPIPDRISIHAPPRGATDIYETKTENSCISIHAPPRGATSNIRRTRCVGYFNSRPSARGDDTRVGIPSCNVISIHAPPRGATYATTSYVDEKTDFNSRPSARGDLGGRRELCRHGISIHAPPRGATDKQRRARAATTFQFTPLREGRPFYASIENQFANFNSRPSARGDDCRKPLSAT